LRILLRILYLAVIPSQSNILTVSSCSTQNCQMDSNIKKELIDGINQLGVKEEE
jgi:hypothetical protein